MESKISQPKIYSFFQPLFCQRTSAHLQKANAIPLAYFAKELNFSIAFLRFAFKTKFIIL